ncbi:hypothetical protein Poli38472_014202 [Pythium oligandrum]|uniref:Uncharacterized protein n=1 Tax=Pythium oligandrum TaxID=41045 RepID=A0A8K1CK13_PYTOL|nr:hypothetical protein Poli38472_014202 [Pythium oligandrum]|eukprot:TMW64085.1 hypothetical protein Poli38472_014202 [Pythium oligandrum]
MTELALSLPALDPNALFFEDQDHEVLLRESEEFLRSMTRMRRTEGERRSRQKRQNMMERMRDQVKALEWIVEHSDEVRVPELTSSLSTQLVDSESMRMRSFLQRSHQVGREIRRLEQEQSQLKRLVREHKLAQKLLRSWVAPPKKSEWELDIDHWNELSTANYEAWTLDDCVGAMKASLEMIHELGKNNNFVSSGCDFMGWKDRRRVDIETSTMHFGFVKEFPKSDAKHIFELFWDMHFSAESLCQHMMGWTNKLHVQLLQKVSEDIYIFRNDTKYSGIDMHFHTVYIMFRLRTPTGFMHCIRTAPSPGIQSVFEGNSGWMNNFYWTYMDAIPDAITGDLTGCRVSFSGLISSHMAFVNRMMLEMVMTLVRAEHSFIMPLFLEV